MFWTPDTVVTASWQTAFLWRKVAGFSLLLFLSMGQSWVEAQIYTWTDEKGVVHYSNSMVPPQAIEQAKTMAASKPSAGKPQEIPLVILNNDPSQKFVQVVLEGQQRSQEALMLVDTGAQMTVIDQALAEELDVEHIENARLVGVAGAAQGWIGRLESLRLGVEEISDLRVMVGPLATRHLLGMDVLERLQLSVGPRTLHPAK
jgi:predicted aspartyl protease